MRDPLPISMPTRIEDIEARARRTVRAGLAAIGVLVAVSGVWMALAPLHGAVIVPATIVVQNYRKTVQHLEGGIVRQILVREGDQVRAGDPLVRLSEIQAGAVVELLQDQMDAELIRSARLRAERDLLPRVEFPSELLSRVREKSKLATLMDSERRFFQARRQQLEGQIAVLRTQIRQINEEIVGLESQLKSANEASRYLAEELKMNVDLADRNFVQKTRVMGFQRQIAEKDEKRGEYAAEIAKAHQKVSEAELRIINLNDAYVREASGELKESNQKIIDLRERLKPSEDALKRLLVLAPVAGRVVDLKVTTVGGIIAPREPLMDIVPSESTLIVEGKVRTDEIAQFQADSSVSVQLSAFKQRTTPLVDGRIIYISSDAITETVNGVSVPFYRVQAELSPASLKAVGIEGLTPGMPAVIFIQTRERTVLDYVIEPVTDSLRRSMREY